MIKFIYSANEREYLASYFVLHLIKYLSFDILRSGTSGGIFTPFKSAVRYFTTSLDPQWNTYTVTTGYTCFFSFAFGICREKMLLVTPIRTLHVLLYINLVHCCSCNDQASSKRVKHDCEKDDRYCYSKPLEPDENSRSNMAYIEAGTYQIGTDEPVFMADGEAPARTVYLDAFYIDWFEVSNSDYQDFVKDSGHVTEAEVFGSSFVFKELLDKGELDKIRQAVLAAPWWVPVTNASWKHPEGLGSSVVCNFNKILRYR